MNLYTTLKVQFIAITVNKLETVHWEVQCTQCLHHKFSRGAMVVGQTTTCNVNLVQLCKLLICMKKYTFLSQFLTSFYS